jgi:hypothetical protein
MGAGPVGIDLCSPEAINRQRLNMPEILILPAAILVTITSVTLLTVRDWRWIIIILAIQYIGVSVLTSAFWPLETALAKMVTGWMAGAVLGIAMAGMPESWREEELFWPSGRIFRLLAAAVIVIFTVSLLPQAVIVVPQHSYATAWGGLILIGLGLLHLGLTAQPLKVSIGLLTLLAGFEIIYAAVENSTLVAGLLAVVNLVLALAGAYLLIAPSMDEVEE